MRSVNSYSLAAAELIVAFGGLPLKNAQIGQGDVVRHMQVEAMQQARETGIKFIILSPIRAEVSDDLDAEWIALRPGWDVAFMLRLAHTMVNGRLHTIECLDRCAFRFAQFQAYLMRSKDDVAKSAEWAAGNPLHHLQDLNRLRKAWAKPETIIVHEWC